MFRFGLENEKGEQKMQKIVSLLVILGMAVTAVAIPNIAEAALTDEFNITITISYFEITLKNSDGSAVFLDWPLGAQAVDYTKTMVVGADGTHGVLLSQSIQAHVGNSAAYKLQGSAANSTHWAVGAATVSDVFMVEMIGKSGTADASMTSATKLANAAADIFGATGAASTDIYLFCRYTAPSATTSGIEQSTTIEITIAAQ